MTVASKIMVGRLNTQGVPGSNGGSFPSGHVIGLVVCLGLVILVLQPRAGPWISADPGSRRCADGASLVLQAAHWFTDIVRGLCLQRRYWRPLQAGPIGCEIGPKMIMNPRPLSSGNRPRSGL